MENIENGENKIFKGFLSSIFDMSKVVDLTNLKQLDNWSILIEGAQGRANEIFEAVKRDLEESRVPGVNCQMVKVPKRTGFLKAEVEDYLMVTNDYLKDFRMYIGARDYGRDLNVSWYLTCEPGPLKQFFSELLTKSPFAFSFSMDVVRFEELTAYVTKVHHSVLKAVASLMQRLGQDASKIERKSRGFLGVS
jgi:serine kinase of HPr protein (carbohydrate metabolism regulator)